MFFFSCSNASVFVLNTPTPISEAVMNDVEAIIFEESEFKCLCKHLVYIQTVNFIISVLNHKRIEKPAISILQEHKTYSCYFSLNPNVNGVSDS